MAANYSRIVYRPGSIISALLIGTVGPCNWSSASPLYKSYFDFVIPKDDAIFFKTKLLDLLCLFYHSTVDRKGIQADAVLSAVHAVD